MHYSEVLLRWVVTLTHWVEPCPELVLDAAGQGKRI